MELLLDRFLVRGTAEAVDLVTGHRVRLIQGMQGAPSEQARWATRCARLAALRHPAFARLIDYGVVGESRRVEIWRGGDEALAHEVEVPRQAAQMLLRAEGLSIGGEWQVVRDRVGCVAIPSSDAGYEESASTALSEPLGFLPALSLLPRASVAAVGDVLQQHAAAPRALSLWGGADSGVNTAILDIARLARLHGFVPVSIEMLRSGVSDALRGRSMLVIARTTVDDAWRAWLEASTGSSARHVLLYAGSEDAQGMVPLVLESFSAESLISAIRPSALSAEWTRRIRDAAQAAHGHPAAFARRLWAGSKRADLRLVSRVAEPRADYGAAPDTEVASLPMHASVNDTQRYREAQSAAEVQLAAGRCAAGERALRQSIGALARRHDWAGATTGALSLAATLTRRGRQADTGAVIELAATYARRSLETRLMLRVAIAQGEHAAATRRFDEAEAVLGSARATARALGDHEAHAAAVRATAWLHVWRGRFDEAASVLGSIGAESLAPADAVAMAILRSAIAIGLGALPDAVAQATLAITTSVGQPSDVQTAAWGARALAHLAVNDHVAVAGDIAEAIRHARSAHHPVAALSARLIGAESERRCGRTRSGRLMARLMRRPSRLPAVLSARVQLTAALVKDASAHTIERMVRTSGLGGLTLFAPRVEAGPPASVVTHVLDILRACQAADDDRRIVERVCEQLRSPLRASACAVFVEERGQLSLAASHGGRGEVSEAERIHRVSDIVGPRQGGARSSHGGAPVRWGGQTIGVLQVTWPPNDGALAAGWDSVLIAAAVALAPIVASERARRARPAAGAWELIGSSDAMAGVRAAVERAAPAPFTVLIEGESGSGKELVARALHKRSNRREKACAVVNCAALPDDLLESELFGHARGAFTGAMAERIGVFEEANGGTLFLDEVGELSPRAQAKLLRAIQEGEIRRVGENVPRRVDVRIVAATNRNLREEVAAGRFRLDLLYRLDVIRIVLPPLRERADDIALLAEHFWREAAARTGSRATLGVASLAALAQYPWPGNVRELQNVLASLIVRVPPRGVVQPSALPGIFHGDVAGSDHGLEAARRTFEASFVRAALARAGGRRTRAAAELGVTRQGLSKLMLRLGLESPITAPRRECV